MWIFLQPKCAQVIGVVYKFSGYVNSKHMILMYKTLVRPHLEYDVPIIMVPHLYQRYLKLRTSTKNMTKAAKVMRHRLSPSRVAI